MIDYRSDTFTKPSPGMLEAMFKAEVGDDVYGEDPTVNRLEKMLAEMFGMESAIFCPSGTMTNQIAIKCHTVPGDEVICDHMSHVYIYEGGGIALNSASSVRAVLGDNGRLTAEQVADSINPDDIHKPRTSLISLENTANRGGGSCYNLTELKNIREVCFKNNLALHLDGARLFNAIVAKNEKPEEYGQIFDSISICLSKGLGTPIGSVLLGTKDLIKRARRIRKVFGGGMRQAGYLAAAGIYALENNIARLEEDHEHARLIAAALAKKDFVAVILPVETNIIIFEVSGRIHPVEFVEKMRENEIRVTAISKTQVRIVLHLDVTKEMVSKTIKVIEQL
ncbi:low-specificity L-threonine aldolase [Segetibacter aerophilus]|uniref:Threonine aldolase n=1 Tax=Segetibacter aerophilus TaxID=670293 RepID=A0A512B931_9BACT|nr:low-specificity L-threonine aldolase [Segetibacter aerophilus]GEO08474.1 threonine aldolase [Segetibacter aerophilus]